MNKYTHTKGGTTVKVDMPDVNKAMRLLGIDERGKVQEFATRTAAARMGKYTPMQTGVLIQTKEIRPTEIEYIQPYSRFLYFGMIMRVNADGTGSTWAPRGGKKYVSRTGKDKLQFGGAPQRGAFWDEKMMAAEGDQLVSEIQEYSNRQYGGTARRAFKSITGR